MAKPSDDAIKIIATNRLFTPLNADQIAPELKKIE